MSAESPESLRSGYAGNQFRNCHRRGESLCRRLISTSRSCRELPALGAVRIAGSADWECPSMPRSALLHCSRRFHVDHLVHRLERYFLVPPNCSVRAPFLDGRMVQQQSTSAAYRYSPVSDRRAEPLSQGEEITRTAVMYVVSSTLPTGLVVDFSQRIAYRTSFEAAGVEDAWR